MPKKEKKKHLKIPGKFLMANVSSGLLKNTDNHVVSDRNVTLCTIKKMERTNFYEGYNNNNNDLSFIGINDAFQSRIISSIPVIQRKKRGANGEDIATPQEHKKSVSAETELTHHSEETHVTNTSNHHYYISPDTLNSLINNLKGILDSMSIPPVPTFIPPNSENKNIRKEIEQLYPYYKYNN